MANANGQAIAAYIAGAPGRALPTEVADMARLCLADWLGVAIGAADEPAGRIVREVTAGWHSEGRATVLFGATAAAPFAALAARRGAARDGARQRVGGGAGAAPRSRR